MTYFPTLKQIVYCCNSVKTLYIGMLWSLFAASWHFTGIALSTKHWPKMKHIKSFNVIIRIFKNWVTVLSLIYHKNNNPTPNQNVGLKLASCSFNSFKNTSLCFQDFERYISCVFMTSSLPHCLNCAVTR